MQRKRHLREWKHPFDAYAFEALLSGSWQAVELIKIESGRTALHFIDKQQIEGYFSDLRIRSRKATLSDCSSFLRPGVDICVQTSSFQYNDATDDQFIPIPVWLDAKINSIQRKPHKSQCTCQYYVNFYEEQGSLGTEVKTLNIEIKAVGLGQISILQKLERNSCDDKPHRWTSSQDCTTIPQTRLVFGKFLSGLSWLVVTSVLKKVPFCVRSIQNKIVYQILGTDNSDSHINVVNLKVKDGNIVSSVAQIEVSQTNTTHHDDHDHAHEDAVSPSVVEVVALGLRRSKRRNIQPERYVGCVVSKLEVGFVRTYPYKRAPRDKSNDDDELLLEYPSEEDIINSGQKVNKVNSRKVGRKIKTRQVEHHFTKDKAKVARSNKAHKRRPGRPKKKNGATSTAIVAVDVLNSEPLDQHPRSVDEENNDGLSLKSYYSNIGRKRKRKDSFVINNDNDLYDEIKWGGLSFNKGSQQRQHRLAYSRNRSCIDEEKYDHKGRSLNANACKEMIDSYMKNINSMTIEEEINVTDEWNEKSNFGNKEEEKIAEKEDEEEEKCDDLDKLWEEMDTALALASSYLEGTEGSNANTEKESKESCEHDFRLDEEIGIYCTRCGFVKTAIVDVCPPIVESPRWHKEEKQCSGEQHSVPKANGDENNDDIHVLSTHASSDESPTFKEIENDNVWGLIPEIIREKMQVHQKKGFEFLWQNIVGSMEPKLMKSESKKRGGCVISHAPGAGKTFLIISFLVSYLKLFPNKRPLVLAPKTTLYTWYKECIKWKIPMPVYLIHGRRNQRDFNSESIILPGVPRPTSDIKHVLDCLNKIKKWHAHPSVLVMGYTSFLSLMREDTKFVHRNYMAKALRESPEILILDEGHNPRSTKSRLRKTLMKVKTELRIVLSGTLFQNNFCEYFNTLCLARPKFVHEVLQELDTKYQRRGRIAIANKAQHLLESRARKFFLDNIAKKIDSDICEERMQGLNVLRKLTSGFIDVYDSGNSDTLPGLQIYTLLINPTNVQQMILHILQRKMDESSGYPLEIELLITLGSIHPWLVKTATCAAKFFSEEELKRLDMYKFDLKIGSKVRFVLSLIFRVVNKEKVLIFCHNLAPMRLLIEIFEKFFQWQNGKEILLLSGELELFDRGKVIDKFEDPNGASKILLASITACAEGISLTAASRVVFLDSEWNPSKTKQAIARAFRPGQQKMVYVYQLLITDSLEEDKYKRTTWKEWVSSMIFSEAFVEDPSKWQAEKIEDDILREMVEEDKSKTISMIMKNEKASTN